LPGVNAKAVNGSQAADPIPRGAKIRTTPTSGRSLTTTVKIDATPDVRTPKALTTVKKTTLTIAVGITKPGPAKVGLIHDSAEAPAIATAAWAARFETQKDHATRKATLRPNCRSILA
jgi:hypothetical protein